MEVVKAAVTVAMVEVGLVLLGLEEGISGENGRKAVGAGMSGRTVLAHGGFMLKVYRNWTQSSRGFWNSRKWSGRMR
jgi:hypothetical protein